MNAPTPRWRSALGMLLLQLGVASFAVLVWHVAVKLSGTKIFPSPREVASALAYLGRRRLLWAYIGDSLFRVACGYLAACLCGIPAGLALGSSPLLERAINPLMQMLRPISPLAWMPLAVIWFGVSNAAPIFLIFLASFFPVVIATMTGVQNVPQVYVRAGRNFGLSRGAIVRRVVFPAVVPRIIGGLRLAFGVAWLVLVAAEMIAVDSGLGYLIIDARNAGKRYDLVVGGMLLIGIIGLAIDVLLRRAERLDFVKWAFENS